MGHFSALKIQGGRVKEYLDRYEKTYHRRLTQKEFVIGLIEQALEEAEEEFEAARAAEHEEQAENGWEPAESPENDEDEEVPDNEEPEGWDVENSEAEAPAEEDDSSEGCPSENDEDTLIHCIAGEKEEVSPIVIENKIKELEIEFDRLLVLAVDENDIIDHKLKQISETILKLKQQKKRLEYTAERSEVMESKAQEVMGLISAEDLDLTEYSDALVYRIIERITVLSKEEIRIRFVGGFEITQPLH